MMNSIKLNNGIEMPMLGLGVWLNDDAKTCEHCVSEAIKSGYRLIDTAATYMNEKAVGRGIIKSGIERSKLFVTTKLWVQDMGYENTMMAVQDALKRLQLDYIDLYLIHGPFPGYLESWKAMEKLCKLDKIKSIGVSNFSIKSLTNVLEHCSIRPVVNQIEFHPMFQNKELVKFMQDNSIQLEAWSPLVHGNPNYLRNTILKNIGEKYNKTAAQITLRWHLQRGSIPIPKSSNINRINENYSIFDFYLSEEEMALINRLNTDIRQGANVEDEKIIAKAMKWKFNFNDQK